MWSFNITNTYNFSHDRLAQSTFKFSYWNAAETNMV